MSSFNKERGNKMKKIFKGIMPALVTPFLNDRKTIDEKAARELIEALIAQGADGFYILGSTGEGILMEESERMKMCEITVSQVAGRKPVILHVADMNFDRAVRLAQHGEKVGVDAISALPPLFFYYSNDDIYDYYKKLAASTSLPFVMYNHTAANGGMPSALVSKLFEEENITGVKWTLNNYYGMMELKEKTKGEMNIINGPDEMLLQGLSAGADAGIGTTYNVMLPMYKEIYRAFNAGEVDKAMVTQRKASAIVTIMIKYEVLPATKHMCKMMGFPVGDCSRPLHVYTEEEAKAFEAELAAAGWDPKTCTVK